VDSTLKNFKKEMDDALTRLQDCSNASETSLRSAAAMVAKSNASTALGGGKNGRQEKIEANSALRHPRLLAHESHPPSTVSQKVDLSSVDSDPEAAVNTIIDVYNCAMDSPTGMCDTDEDFVSDLEFGGMEIDDGDYPVPLCMDDDFERASQMPDPDEDFLPLFGLPWFCAFWLFLKDPGATHFSPRLVRGCHSVSAILLPVLSLSRLVLLWNF